MLGGRTAGGTLCPRWAPRPSSGAHPFHVQTHGPTRSESDSQQRFNHFHPGGDLSPAAAATRLQPWRPPAVPVPVGFPALGVAHKWSRETRGCLCGACRRARRSSRCRMYYFCNFPLRLKLVQKQKSAEGLACAGRGARRPGLQGPRLPQPCISSPTLWAPTCPPTGGSLEAETKRPFQAGRPQGLPATGTLGYLALLPHRGRWCGRPAAPGMSSPGVGLGSGLVLGRPALSRVSEGRQVPAQGQAGAGGAQLCLPCQSRGSYWDPHPRTRGHGKCSGTSASPAQVDPGCGQGGETASSLW